MWSRALVTGASSGIGEALAERLASSGVAVVLVGRSAALGAVAERIARAGGEVQAVQADLSVEEDLERVASLVRTAVPAIDLLVNNAGVGRVRDVRGPAARGRDRDDQGQRRGTRASDPRRRSARWSRPATDA